MSSSHGRLDELRIDRGSQPGRRSRKWLLLFLLPLLLALVWAAYWWRSQAGVVEVRTALAREIGGTEQRTVLNASGYVTARRQATVSSKVTGKVVEVLIEEGMRVEQGQVLARLDDTNVKAGLEVARAQLESARAAVEETRAQLKRADLEFRRTSELARQNIASQADLDRAESDAKMLQARLARQERDVDVAQRELVRWQRQMDDMTIRAPFRGIVTTKDSQPGEMISPVSAGGGFTRTGIGTIVDMDSLEIEIDVSESYINRVEPGQAVEAALDAYPDWKIPCKVVAIIPTADRQKSTVRVRVGFDRLDPRILPEMSVKVAFRESNGAASHRSVVVPRKAVQNREGRDVVFMVVNGKAERRAVTTGSVMAEEAVLTAGVTGGERVIIEPPPILTDGARVKEFSSDNRETR